MKKLLFVVASLTLITACGGGQTATTEALTEQSESKKIKPIEITKAEFLTKVANYETDSVWKYLGDKPAIIDFYASWCGPCKSLAPLLDELALEYANDIVIYKVNVEKEKELASDFGITTLPTMLFVPINYEPKIWNGLLPKETIKDGIDQILLNKK